MKKYLKKTGSFILRIIFGALFFLCGAVIRIIYLPKVEYRDPAAKAAMKKGAVLIANHQNHKDGIFVPQMLPFKKIHVLVTRKWYDKKYLNVMFRHLPYIPINLNEPDSEWMIKSEELLKSGHNVLIFPEGRLERGERVPFQSGFLLPVKHLGVPVIPMAIVGEYRPFHRQKLIIGSPVELDFNEKGRLSQILKKAAITCEKKVFELYDGDNDKKSRNHIT